nr:hypothetical protein [uncultured Flavobacterium sp.]
MKKIILLMSLLLLLLISCNKSEAEAEKDPYPECISTQIDVILKNYSPRIPRSNVKKYKYNEQYVYAVEINGIPDEQKPVYNEKCELICSRGGIGITNKTCVNWESAVFIETVWTDPR